MSANNSPTQVVARELRDPSRPPIRILCVEDNDGDFVLLREELNDAGFSAPLEIQRARSMSEAICLIVAAGSKEPFDIVLLDLSLPDTRGSETYQRLRAVAPRVAVAILSGNSDQKLALELVQKGAQDYLPKDSLTPDLLMRCITYAMKRQRYRVELETLADRLRLATEDLKNAQMQLIHAEKVESLGRLASSVAHEVKNPLGVIQMGLEYLGKSLPGAGEDIACTLGLMKEAVARADAVIRDMLDFSRSDGHHMQSCAVNDIVHCAMRMLKHEMDRRNITLHMDLDASEPRSLCDQTGIEQVLINVAMNSLHAMERGKTLNIRTRGESIGELPGNDGHGANSWQPGDATVVIEVRDQGTGIPEEMMKRVFEPFFTTKPAGEGTGLGLSVCRRIVELHHGQLLLTNVKDPGGLLVSIILKAEAAGACSNVAA